MTDIQNVEFSNQQSVKKRSPVQQVLFPIRGQLFIAMLFTVVGSMLSIAPLISMVYIAELLFSTAGIKFHPDLLLQQDVLSALTIGLVGLCLGMLLIALGELLAHLADHKLTYQLRTGLVKHLAQVQLGWFNQRSSGEVKQILQDDIGALHSLTAHFFPTVGRTIGTILAVIGYLMLMNWYMTLIVLLPFLGFVLFLRKALKASGDQMYDFAGKMEKMNTTAVEFVHAIPIIKTFNVASEASTGYQQAVKDFAIAFKNFTRPLIAAMSHAHAMISPITIVGVVLISGSVFMYLDWITAIEIFTFALIAPVLSAPVLLLHTLLHDLQASEAAAQRVLDLHEVPILETLNYSEQQSFSEQQNQQGHDIVFHDVSYAYDDAKHAVKNLNFTIPAGSMTAIVGPSGAGKSTIAQLLLRFFDPNEGQITLGGVDIRCFPSTELYQQIGFVLQEVQLIHATIRENIVLGRPTATQQEVEAAAKIANIHDYISTLEKGYETVIGQDLEFSGGERQRLSIARAVLLNSPVLVLDEATAAVDTRNEVNIQNALANFTQNRSLLVIAHRLETIIHADQILFVDEGIIRERGTHLELLALNGRYAQLWAIVSQSYREQQAGASC